MTEREVSDLYKGGSSFRQELIAKRWLVDVAEGSETAGDPLQFRPSDLFSNAERPLVVGLFGGTGVGKSSLLNRLADAEIARTGVV